MLHNASRLTQSTGFAPSLPLRNGHLQTILNSAWPRKKLFREQIQRVANAAEIRLIDCGQGVRLLGAFNRAVPLHSGQAQPLDQSAPSRPANRGLVILLHGWEGSFESTYVMTATSTLVAAGFDVFRLNLRDHGPSLHLNRALFNATLTDEVTNAVRAITAAHSPPACFLAGFSLGGNFALRIAADSGLALNLTAAMGICPATDPAHTMRILENPYSLYHAYFFRKWRASLQTKLVYYPDLAYHAQLKRCRTLADINRFFIPDHTPCGTPDNYFAAYALAGHRLAKLRTPALLVATRDDPIIPAADMASINASADLEIELLDDGGHCGFMENHLLDSWVEKRMVDYFLSTLASGSRSG